MVENEIKIIKTVTVLFAHDISGMGKRSVRSHSGSAVKGPSRPISGNSCVKRNGILLFMAMSFPMGLSDDRKASDNECPFT